MCDQVTSKNNTEKPETINSNDIENGRKPRYQRKEEKTKMNPKPHTSQHHKHLYVCVIS
jgi:hypothetical protein